MKKAKLVLLSLVWIGALVVGCKMSGDDAPTKKSQLSSVTGVSATANSPYTVYISFDSVLGAAQYEIEWESLDRPNQPTCVAGIDSGDDRGSITISAYKTHSESSPYKINHTFKPGRAYSFSVRAIDEDGNKGSICRDTCEVSTLLPAPTCTILKVNSTTFDLVFFSSYITTFDIYINGVRVARDVLIDSTSGEYTYRYTGAKLNTQYSITVKHNYQPYIENLTRQIVFK